MRVPRAAKSQTYKVLLRVNHAVRGDPRAVDVIARSASVTWRSAYVALQVLEELGVVRCFVPPGKRRKLWWAERAGFK